LWCPIFLTLWWLLEWVVLDSGVKQFETIQALFYPNHTHHVLVYTTKESVELIFKVSDKADELVVFGLNDSDGWVFIFVLVWVIDVLFKGRECLLIVLLFVVVVLY
jgi:hypothetical protein